MNKVAALATRYELAKGALEHYERLSRECCDYYNLIPKCIDAWKNLPEQEARISELEAEKARAIAYLEEELGEWASVTQEWQPDTAHVTMKFVLDVLQGTDEA